MQHLTMILMLLAFSISLIGCLVDEGPKRRRAIRSGRAAGSAIPRVHGRAAARSGSTLLDHATPRPQPLRAGRYTGSALEHEEFALHGSRLRSRHGP